VEEEMPLVLETSEVGLRDVRRRDRSSEREWTNDFELLSAAGVEDFEDSAEEEDALLLCCD
jgi:hypothetical protein